MILYLGIDPSRWKGEGKILHYPVIRTELIEWKEPVDWTLATHLLFTSRSAVQHWRQFDKQILTIGNATAQLLKEQGLECLIAPEATQEGVIALLETLDLTGAYLIWPRSERARNNVALYLEKRKVRFLAIDLYRTLFQKLEPVPSLDKIDEIVFTSPSTVDAFLEIYGTLPANKKLTPIGPITKKYLGSAPIFSL